MSTVSSGHGWRMRSGLTPAPTCRSCSVRSSPVIPTPLGRRRRTRRRSRPFRCRLCRCRRSFRRTCGGSPAVPGTGGAGRGRFDRGEQPTAVVIAAVAGTAGIGKTALAVHWAHRVGGPVPGRPAVCQPARLRPVRRGDGPADGAARIPAERWVCRPTRIPADWRPRPALYRSLLADQRMLVVLDNARDADQVRPLLPGAPGCLVAGDQPRPAHRAGRRRRRPPVTLDLLTADEARHLLARRLGAARVAAEAEAVDDIIDSCAPGCRWRWRSSPPAPPAAQTSRSRTWPTSSGDARQSRRVQRGATRAIDLRAVFSWSYESLSPAAARMFRLLGLHAGPDFSVPRWPAWPGCRSTGRGGRWPS